MHAKIASRLHFLHAYFPPKIGSNFSLNYGLPWHITLRSITLFLSSLISVIFGANGGHSEQQQATVLSGMRFVVVVV